MLGRSEDGASRSWGAALTPYLTNLSQASAPFLSTFLMIHLSAPIVANIGGSSLSSQVMLLGREYYQTSFGERYLLLTPFFVHVGAAALKRITSPEKPRSWSSTLAVTGYLTGGILLPIHYVTHRVFPASPYSPIDAVGPAQLDFEFVKTALSTWPIRSWLLYGALVTGVALHASEGMQIILQNFLGFTQGLRKRTRRVLAGAIILPVLSGLLVLSREPVLTFIPTALRYRAALEQSIYYRV